MPVAETASTFNENIIMNAAIDEAEGETKLALIETQLQDLTQIMCDIYSRFLFEKKVFEKRKEGFLFPDELEAMMLDLSLIHIFLLIRLLSSIIILADVIIIRNNMPKR